MESLLEMRPSVLAFFTSFCTMVEGTQLVAEVVAFPLAMLFFTARCFTRIYEIHAWGLCTREVEIGNGGGGGEKELVNSTIPHSTLYTFSVKERGLRHSERSGSGSRATHETVRA
jgi:hypothetical protein